MEVGRTYSEKKGHKYHKTGTRMESTGSLKTGKTKIHLAQRTTQRTKNNWQDLERGKENSKRQKEVERNCSRPMSPFGRSGLSQVSHCYSFIAYRKFYISLIFENKIVGIKF